MLSVFFPERKPVNRGEGNPFLLAMRRRCLLPLRHEEREKGGPRQLEKVLPRPLSLLQKGSEDLPFLSEEKERSFSLAQGKERLPLRATFCSSFLPIGAKRKRGRRSTSTGGRGPMYQRERGRGGREEAEKSILSLSREGKKGEKLPARRRSTRSHGKKGRRRCTLSRRKNKKTGRRWRPGKRGGKGRREVETAKREKEETGENVELSVGGRS